LFRSSIIKTVVIIVFSLCDCLSEEPHLAVTASPGYLDTTGILDPQHEVVLTCSSTR